MRRWLRNLALGVLGFVLLLGTFPEVLLVLLTLAFGWISALHRIATVMIASPGALSWAGLAMALILAGTHWLGTWFWRDARGGAAGNHSRWPWRWTLMLHAGLAAVLFAAMSMTGVAHQTGWLLAAREPMFVAKERRSYGLAYMHQLAGAIETTGIEHHWDVPTMRTQVWALFRDPGDMRERLHAILIEGTNGRLACALVFPRDPKSFALTGVGIVEPGTRLRTEPASELANLRQFPAPPARTAGLTP